MLTKIIAKTELEKTEIETQQKNALGIIWKSFGYNKTEMAKAIGVNLPVVINWFSRGRISAVAAIKIENHELLEGVITKEEMRPDITEWFGV